MPTPGEIQEFVQTYCRAVSGRDVAAIAALFAEDAEQRDPMAQPARLGRAAIAEFFAQAVAASNSTDFSATDVHPSGDHVAFHFTVEVALEAGTMTIDGIETFAFDPAGRIARAEAYWDDSSVRFA
jgi:steroid delta-isomerase